MIIRCAAGTGDSAFPAILAASSAGAAGGGALATICSDVAAGAALLSDLHDWSPSVARKNTANAPIHRLFTPCLPNLVNCLDKHIAEKETGRTGLRDFMISRLLD